MPSSPAGIPSTFAQILPGAPSVSLQALSRFVFRQKTHVAYLSGPQLNILTAPNTLVQSLTFADDLLAIIAEDDSGKIVVASARDVFVLEPVTEGWSKIWWEKTLWLRREDAGDEAHWLSWGDEGEVLVGGSHALSLFSSRPFSRDHSPPHTPDGDSMIEKRTPLWSIPVASPVLFAEFSPSATLIATCARRDRLVKIWRRLSFEEGLFDYTYLPHAGIVTHLQWRPSDDTREHRRSSSLSWRHDEQPEVLYTIASDGMLRTWRTGASFDANILVPHASMHLGYAIPDSPTPVRSEQGQSPARYVFFIPTEQFCAAVTAALGLPQAGKLSHQIEYLKEIASQEPDIVVTLDDQGRMSAWGLQSIGHKRRPETPTIAEPYHLAHGEGLSLKFPQGCPTIITHWFQDSKIQLLAHTVSSNGQIAWWEGDVDAFFSPSAAGPERLQLRGVWCGHDAEIEDLQSSSKTLVSWSEKRKQVWSAAKPDALQPIATVQASSPVLAATVIEPARVLLSVHANEFNLWDLDGRRLASVSSETSDGGKIYTLAAARDSAYGLFVSDDQQKWTRWLARLSSENGTLNGSLELQSIALPEDIAKQQLVPVAVPHVSGHSRIVSVTPTGEVQTLYASTQPDALHEFQVARTFETDVSAPDLASANHEMAVLTTAGKELCIVDLSDGFVEHRGQTQYEVLQLEIWDLGLDSNLLAVGSAVQIDVFAKGRYSFGGEAAPAWSTIKSVSLTHIGPRINALAWTHSGGLAIAAGNSIMVAGAHVGRNEISEAIAHVFDADAVEESSIPLLAASGVLQAALPLWSPAALSNLLQRGQISRCTTILQLLAQKLKFWSPGDELNLGLDEVPEPFVSLAKGHPVFDVSDDTLSDLREHLDSMRLPRLSPTEQTELRLVVEVIAYLRDHSTGLDLNAVRYLFSWKLQLLRTENNSKPTDQRSALEMDWQAIAFANHSVTQQPLLDLLMLHYDNKLTWPLARSLGLLAWLSEREAVEQVFEQLAQSAYRSSQPPDPVNAALFFLALRKKPTLVGLWRIATWHKEQKSTMNFLKRDFALPDTRTAAKKNAYALMGKRRFEYSAAFFLLGDDPLSAVNTLASQCEDVLLAIAVARVYCGDGSAVLRQLVEERLLPQTAKERNRWFLSWCHTMLGNKRDAAEVLVQPLPGVRRWTQDDPNTLLLYRQLRTTSSEHEYPAVLRSARILRKMGLWTAALDLVVTWDFPAPVLVKKTSTGAAADGKSAADMSPTPPSLLDDFGAPAAAPSLLDSFSSPPAAPSLLDSFTSPSPPAAPADDAAARAAKAAELLRKMQEKKKAAAAAAASENKEDEKKDDEKKKRAPTQFTEPDANSLLDSFGF